MEKKQTLALCLFLLLAGIGIAFVFKKRFRHKSFLYMIVGIAILIIAINFWVKKEEFQVLEIDTASICSYISFPVNIPGINSTSTRTSSIISLLILLNGNTSNNVSIGNIATLPVQRFRNIIMIMRFFYISKCYSRLIQLLSFMASTNTLIFPYKFTHPNFTAGVAGLTITEPSDLSRLQNFKFLLQDASFRNAKTVARMEGTALPVPWSSVANVDAAQREPSLTSIISIMFLFQHWIALRSWQNNETIYLLGVWLERALSFARSRVEINMGLELYIAENIACILASYTRAPGNSVVDPTPFCENLIYYITGKATEDGRLANPPSVMNPEIKIATYVNRIPGFIFEATNPQTIPTIGGVIQDHISKFRMILFAIFILRNFAGDVRLPEMRCGTYSGGIKLFKNATVNTILDDEDCIRGIILRIARNICCDHLINEQLRESQMTPESFHILMRNFIGNPKCSQPLSIDTVLEQIKNPEFSTTELSPTAIGPMVDANILSSSIPTTLHASASVLQMNLGIEIKQLIFKTNLDENNWTSYNKQLGSSISMDIPDASLTVNLPDHKTINTNIFPESNIFYNTVLYLLGIPSINTQGFFSYPMYSGISSAHSSFLNMSILDSRISIMDLESFAAAIQKDRVPRDVDSSIL